MIDFVGSRPLDISSLPYELQWMLDWQIKAYTTNCNFIADPNRIGRLSAIKWKKKLLSERKIAESQTYC
jgi:hypothetical protein